MKHRISNLVTSVQRAAGNLLTMTSSVVTRTNGIDLSHEKWDEPQMNVSASFTSAGMASSETVTSSLGTAADLCTASAGSSSAARISGPQGAVSQSRI